MCSGERPTGATKGKQIKTMASCYPAPPPPSPVTSPFFTCLFFLCLTSRQAISPAKGVPR